jgi:Fic-DOC domain mobile mystery protein B
VKIAQPPGATPLDPDDIAGLLPTSIATQEELNAFEQANIGDASMWALQRKRRSCLAESFVRGLHRRMLGQVWRWAGTYRRSDKNIGAPWPQIPERVVRLCGDAAYWIEHAIYAWDELGARFHHRLVAIHPFPNGNGRHARLMTDVLLHAHDQTLFSWGRARLGPSSPARERYLAALKAADDRDLAPLIEFVRS